MTNPVNPIVPGGINHHTGGPIIWVPERTQKSDPSPALIGLRLGTGLSGGMLHESGRGEKRNDSQFRLNLEAEAFTTRLPLKGGQPQYHEADGVGLKYTLSTQPTKDAASTGIDHRVDLYYRVMFGDLGQTEVFLGPTFMMGETFKYGYGGTWGALYRFGVDQGVPVIPYLGLRMTLAGGKEQGTRGVLAEAGLFAGVEFSSLIGE